MFLDSNKQQWGMGHQVDPDFEARVWRIAAGLGKDAAQEDPASGYIELAGGNPLDSVHALLAQIYHQPPATPDRDPTLQEPMLVKEIRFLATDPKCGIALPMYGFMPARVENLESAMALLDKATKGRLREARDIRLTVTFHLQVVARALRRLLSRDETPTGRRWSDRDLEQLLFGARLERSFDVQRVGLAGTFSPQLASAQRLLQTPPPADLQDYGFTATGRNTIVGIIDFGCDFAHPSFRTGARGTGSRILALWDQNEKTASPGSPPTVAVNGVKYVFGYGRYFQRDAIELALAQWQGAAQVDPDGPYTLLGYDPHENHYTSKQPGSAGGPEGAHGTHVMEVAAGGRRTVPAGTDPAAQPCGVAPDADIVFVQVRVKLLPDGRRELDMADVVEAVSFVFRVAESKNLPCVVNLSLNTMSGPHDGDGYFDMNLATLLRSGAAGNDAKGRAVVIAAGNLPDSSVQAMRWQHVTDLVAATPVEFYWRMAPRDLTRNIIEIWYDATDGWLEVSLESPEQQLFGPVKPGKVLALETNGQWRGSVIGSRLVTELDAEGALVQPAQVQPAPQPQDDPDQQAPVNPDAVPGRHVIRLELGDVSSTPVEWKVKLRVMTPDGNPPPSGGAVRFHAWLERDDNGPSGLSRGNQPPGPIDADRPCTIGTLSCGPDAIVVGGYSTCMGTLGPWGLSGHGPSRRGTTFKPDLAAPGHFVSLVRSRRGNGLPQTLARVTGTSVAAPFVTGTIACVYERAPQASLAAVRNALVQTALPLPGAAVVQPLPGQPAGWSSDLGHGRLDPAAVLARFP